MYASEFGKIVENRIQLIKSVLASKGTEYAKEGGDRLHNFKRAAEALRTTPEKALVGMFTKHLVSILDIVDNLNVKEPSVGTVDEKIGDAINYLILLEGLLKERISGSDHLPVSKIAGAYKQVWRDGAEALKEESVKAYFVDGDAYPLPVQAVPGEEKVNGVIVLIPESKKFTHVTVTRNKKSVMVHYA